MNLTLSVAHLRERLCELAQASAGDEGRALIDKIGPALEPSLTLVLLEAMSAAVRDVSDELRIQSVDVTSDGVELALAPAVSPDIGGLDRLEDDAPGVWDSHQIVRTTLRIPSGLRDAISSRAEHDGESANSWMLRVLTRGVGTSQSRSPDNNGDRMDALEDKRNDSAHEATENDTSGIPPAWPSHWVRATLSLVVLRALEPGPSYGYVILSELAAAGLEQVKEGTLYQLLSRLEESGLVTTEWKNSTDGPARKYLALTDMGRDTLNRQRQDWTQFTHGIARALDADQADSKP